MEKVTEEMRTLVRYGGDVRNEFDLDAVEVGSKDSCRKVALEGRDYLVVSKGMTIKSSYERFKETVETVIAPLPLRPREDGNVVCYRFSESSEGCGLVIDIGITFEGDVQEFGRYFLWNPEDGRLSISEEVCRMDYKGSVQ